MSPVVIYPIDDEIVKNLGLESKNNKCSLSRYPKTNEVIPKAANVKGWLYTFILKFVK
ncbi:Alr2476 protein [Bacillus altitudinis]|nr:Alr2476 protein [Bacillus pumilus]